METRFLTCLCFLCTLTVSRVDSKGGRPGEYSNEWLLQTNATVEEVKKMAEQYGLEYSHQVLPGYYVLRQPAKISRASPSVLSTKQRGITDELQVKTIKHQKYLVRERRGQITIRDSYWSYMWYLHQDRVPSMNVYEAWEMGYSGAGIQVAVLDDGIEKNHADLRDNYVAQYSYDYIYDSNDPYHGGNDYHGTWCSGIISAAKNYNCIVGVAFNSKFSAVLIFDSQYTLTAAGEAKVLVHELSHIDIYSNSWGPPDDGETFEEPEDVVKEAFIKGVTEGRNGKGAIYTWAAGNGGSDSDNCNCDGYASSIYTIAITSVSADLQAANYAERCTSILAGTYGGDQSNPAICTTDVNGRCTKSFSGTSATCPIATGIIAMVLEANADLTWRDIQYLIVETSSHDNLNHPTSLSGAGKQVNQYFGFGLMNAEAMVNKALSWKNVPDQAECRSSTIYVNYFARSSISSEHTSDGCSKAVRYLEHVQARVDFRATKRGAVEIFLTSPSGLESQLLTSRPNDRSSASIDWTFMTVHHWGENPAGKWQLSLQATEGVVSLYDWQLILYGTAEPTTTTTEQVTTTQKPPTTTTAGNQEEDSGQEGQEEEVGQEGQEEQGGQEGDTNIGVIVGGVVGGVAAFVIVIIVVVKFCTPSNKVTAIQITPQQPVNNTQILQQHQDQMSVPNWRRY